MADKVRMSTIVTVDGEEFAVSHDVKQMLFSDDVGEDVKFAIVHQLKSRASVNSGSDNVGQSNSSTTKEPVGSDSNNNQVTYVRWSERDEKLLVETRAEMESEFKSNKAHAPLWNKVAKKMASHNVYITSRQVQDKWKNLKKKFNEVVDLNNKTGNGREECKFYRTFSSLYGAKSSTAPKYKMDTDRDETDKGNDDAENRPSTSAKKGNTVESCPSISVGKSSTSENNPRKRKLEVKSKSMSSSDKIAKLVEKIDKKNDEFIDMFRELETEKAKRFDRFLEIYAKSKGIDK